MCSQSESAVRESSRDGRGGQAIRRTPKTNLRVLDREIRTKLPTRLVQTVFSASERPVDSTDSTESTCSYIGLATARLQTCAGERRRMQEYPSMSLSHTCVA
jgi:hypothetical protein